MKFGLLKSFTVKYPLAVLSALCTQAEVKHLLTLKINVFCRLYNYTVRACWCVMRCLSVCL